MTGTLKALDADLGVLQAAILGVNAVGRLRGYIYPARVAADDASELR